MAESTDPRDGKTVADVPLVVAALVARNPLWVTEHRVALGETTIVVPPDQIVEVCTFLKAEKGFQFNLLADLCGCDRGIEEDPRFEVNYHLFSTIHHHRIRLKVLISEQNSHVASVSSVWRTANWHERETFDLVGITFNGHPDLRRILMPDDAVGHPLRKDYPLRGYEPYSLT